VTRPAHVASEPVPREPADLERSIARLLTGGTYASIALLVVGVALMLGTGIGPRTGGPAFDPRTLLSDLAAFRPSGFLWLGLVVMVATPAARVIASLVGFARRGEREMVLIAGLILMVIGLSVILATALES
jgi:uncharacterized membrane protein